MGTASGSLPLEDAVEGRGLNVLWDRILEAICKDDGKELASFGFKE